MIELLRERVRVIWPVESAENDDSKWVLYWMRTAMRGHDNPALDAAVTLANKRGLSVLVYQELRADGPRPYANDRHHTFVLQGARDVQRELAGRGISYALHVERQGHKPSHLLALAEKACAVVVEDLPVYWHQNGTEELVEEIDCGVLAVDTACIVPSRLIQGRHQRAYQFRRAHGPLLQERIRRRWTSVDPEFEEIPAEVIAEVAGFSSIDLEVEEISDLVAACPIDHSVGAVGDTPGGSEAAYQRWRAFRDGPLENYHHVRNDAARPHGVSRLSAYLHYGQISPFRVAWQAASLEGEGPEKFIDELITWREFAHHIGSYQEEAPGVGWLPDWAIETLRDHQSDERPALYDWETLSRGETGDWLWNLCQRSLLAHGELHNNLRMTWGKQFLQWTADVEEAIELAVDLNDRYALDGADPNSYLGILWCFGAFDRPFEPEVEVIGRVRPRSTERHGRRLQRKRYEEWVNRPALQPAPRVAVIGAGVAGLMCGRIIDDHRVPVQVFDKGRGPGGRTSTRRTREGLFFDHGAQYFTARGEVFRRYSRAWEHQGVVSKWQPRLGVFDEDGFRRKEEASRSRFVGNPGMNAVAAHLAEGLDVEYSSRVVAVQKQEGDGWALELESGGSVGPFDVVVVTLPAPQAAELLKEAAPGLAKKAGLVEFSPTWAVMMAFEEPLEFGADAAFVNDGPLGWIARNGSKPGRENSGEVDTWVLHGTPEWSTLNVEMEAEEVAALLAEQFSTLLARCGASLPPAVYRRAHRWRYARADPPLGIQALQEDDAPGLILCGDWLAGSRIEGAFSSGVAAAGRVVSGGVPF